MEEFLRSLQKACLPGVWSKGVSLARDKKVTLDRFSDEEAVFRVQTGERAVAAKVSLWPGDEDYFCDCDEQADPCMHVAAAVIRLRNGTTPDVPAPGATGGASKGPVLSYRFTRADGGLRFTRLLDEKPLGMSLVSYLGGVQSGRVQGRPVAATQGDLAVDGVLSLSDPPPFPRLLKALEECSNVTLDGAPVSASGKPLGWVVTVDLDPSGGFVLRTDKDTKIVEAFRNGLVLLEGGVLRPFSLPVLTGDESALFEQLARPEGKRYRVDEVVALVTEVLPALRRKFEVRTLTAKLPETLALEPRAVLQVQQLGEALTVMPHLVYGDPLLAKVDGRSGRLELVGRPRTIPLRDVAAEKALALRLRDELHLRPGELTKFEGREAVDFEIRSRAWTRWPQSSDTRAFRVTGSLSPSLGADASGRFELRFASSDSSGSGSGEADPAQVFAAWRRGDEFVPLLGGQGWAQLPRDWLERYGARIEELLEARAARPGAEDRKVPRALLPAVAELLEETGQPIEAGLRQLHERLEGRDRVPAAELPGDLAATLREYQRHGVDWLCFLRDAGLGALLADDMGLGKTLQAMCALRGRSLVVAPTSVLHAWKEQLARFRPGLRVSVYHGAGRKLDEKAAVTLTTHALLRLDRDALGAVDWDVAVIDEAQAIKNPESQLAQAAHALRAGFRLALSGTPIENRLDDLWSQFRFLNPDLLGTRSRFQERYAQPVARGDAQAGALLRARIRPFLLRRLKRDVAPELPPRTDVVVKCELSPPERELYDALLAATRKEVAEKLASASGSKGGGLFAALEALLRLRQACCDPALVPGAARSAPEVSSKVGLLLEKLDEATQLGHRALVFSQWTGFLDRIASALDARGMAWLRLDGSTQNREEVVARFQREDGPPVFLISLKAGGVGITLTAADQIFLMDPWWNPAAEDQAADRAHRIGQKNPVLVHRLVAAETVEERILALQASKLAAAAAVLDGTAGSVGITREEILSLLEGDADSPSA